VSSGTCLLGPQAIDEVRERFSAQNLVNAQPSPCFIWHTASDSCVPVRNSFEFALKLRSYGIPFELHVFPNGDHGLGLAQDYPDVREWAPLSADWIDRNFPAGGSYI
jgi:dipeptidyl aminopeptidase/acylaminoacyl peptidase